VIHGLPAAEWKRYQTEATPEQLARMDEPEEERRSAQLTAADRIWPRFYPQAPLCPNPRARLSARA
jgi:hypothetical protein